MARPKKSVAKVPDVKVPLQAPPDRTRVDCTISGVDTRIINREFEALRLEQGWRPPTIEELDSGAVKAPFGRREGDKLLMGSDGQVMVRDKAIGVQHKKQLRERRLEKRGEVWNVGGIIIETEEQLRRFNEFKQKRRKEEEQFDQRDRDELRELIEA